MSAFSDLLAGVKDVLLLRSKVERLEDVVSNVAGDLKDLARAISLLEQRLARLEGFIEGAATVSGQARRLPEG